MTTTSTLEKATSLALEISTTSESARKLRMGDLSGFNLNDLPQGKREEKAEEVLQKLSKELGSKLESFIKLFKTDVASRASEIIKAIKKLNSDLNERHPQHHAPIIQERDMLIWEFELLLAFNGTKEEVGVLHRVAFAKKPVSNCLEAIADVEGKIVQYEQKVSSLLDCQQPRDFSPQDVVMAVKSITTLRVTLEFLRDRHALLKTALDSATSSESSFRKENATLYRMREMKDEIIEKYDGAEPFNFSTANPDLNVNRTEFIWSQVLNIYMNSNF